MSAINAIINLKGSKSTAEWDFRNTRVAVELDTRDPRNIRGLQLNRDGLMGYKGDLFICIPTAEIWKLFESSEQQFKAPAPVPAPKPAKTATKKKDFG